MEELLPSVNEELKKKKFQGELVFDLLLSNGNNSSRFFQITFNGNTAELSSLKKLKNPDDSILEKVNAYLKKHMDILSNGVLSSAEISHLKEVL